MLLVGWLDLQNAWKRVFFVARITFHPLVIEMVNTVAYPVIHSDFHCFIMFLLCKTIYTHCHCTGS